MPDERLHVELGNLVGDVELAVDDPNAAWRPGGPVVL